MSRTKARRRPTAPKTTKTAPDRPTPAAPVHLSLVKPLSLIKKPRKKRLPTRPYMTDLQGYATLAALRAGIPTPRITDWTDHTDGTATRHFPDRTLLAYQHDTRTLTWHAYCPQYGHHTYPIHTTTDLQVACARTTNCTRTHTPQPAVRTLTDAFRYENDRTQPLSLAEIADTLQTPTIADTETPKEHPQP